jgi:diguanylate cyclase (GGDEF)-like protein
MSMHAPDAEPSLTILIVDGEASARSALRQALEKARHQVLEAPSAESALSLFLRYQPDLVLLDVVLPDHDGYWVARELRQAEPGGWTPIIFLSGLGQDLDLHRGIEAGGDDYLVKPVSPIVLAAKLRAMQRLLAMRKRLVDMSEELNDANQRLQQMVELDALTGLINRGGMDRSLHSEIVAARRDQTPLTLVMCDVDYFKLYNDSLGHLQGDACLRRIAELLKQVCRRPRDLAARYGGEEFALILPNTPLSGAMTFARVFLRAIAKLALPHPCSPVADYVTVSGGITTCVPDASTTAQGMILRADEALYAAKAHGRNRFFSFEMQLDTAEQLSTRPGDLI